MSSVERWRRVSDVLSEALDLPRAERSAYISEAIRQQPDLRTEILAVARELDTEGDSLELPLLHELGPGSRVGPYRIVRPLGAGGMGVVYLAERDDGQFERRVAIKLIRGAMPDEDRRRRFRDERRILAALDHENIARLFDAGIDASGVPYLVMEYVEGRELTTWCRERRLGLRQRLEMFLDVCAGVEHAHQHLVIHRDLKPANILVTEAGVPKLLDFGIAKLLESDREQEITETENRVLTLDHASPEQVRGEPVGVAADVYSLGIVLYRLLTARKPYECDPGALSEAVHLVCERVPPLPSAVAPEGDRGALRGDLDAIVMKSLEKAPADRYGTVLELAEDVRRLLDHRPVRARRATWTQAARKFVRRHRLGVAAAAAAIAIVLGGLVSFAWQARIAERNRLRAQERFDQVRDLANYVIYELQDRIARLPGSTALRRHMVEQSLVYLDSLSADSEGDTALQRELAGGYKRLGEVLGRARSANLGDPEGALASYRKAESLLRRALDASPADAQTRRDLGWILLRIHEHLRDAQADGRRLVLEEALGIWRELMRESPGEPRNLAGLAAARFASYLSLVREDRPAAVEHMEEALRLHQDLLDREPGNGRYRRNVALCHKTLGSVAIEQGDLARALDHARAAADVDAERMAADPESAAAKLDYSFDLSLLGDVHLHRGESAAALGYFEEALALRRDLWEVDRENVFARSRLAYMLARVGEARFLAGPPEAAREPLQEALEHALELDPEPVGVRPILARAALFRAEVERLGGGDPCPWYEVMASNLSSVPSESWFVPPAAQLRDRSLERLKSCQGRP